MKTTTTYGALILALVMGTGLATAADTARFWAEPGDHVGLFNHWTATIETLDPYGYEGKAAEDWGLFEEHAFSGLFAWNRVWDSGRHLTMRGAGNNRGENGAAGFFDLDGGAPGDFNYGASYRNFNHYYDGTSELTYPMDTEPEDLVFRPDLRWTRGRMDARYRLNGQLTLFADIDEMRRSGEKGSLARSARGLAAPGVKEFETKSVRVTMGGDWRAGGLHGDLALTLGKDEGTRLLRGQHAASDDRIATAVRGGVAWNGEGLTLLGRFAAAKLDVTPAEAVSAEEHIDLEQSSQSGAVAAMWAPSATIGLTVSARVQSISTDGATPDGNEAESLDRQRDRTGLRADLKWKAPARTRVVLGFRYDKSDLLETLVEAGGTLDPAQSTDQERTTTTLSFKASRRFSPKMTAKFAVRSSAVEIVQAETGDLRYWQGDRKRDRLQGSLGVIYAPRAGVRLDLGGQAIRQTFERNDLAGVETTFDADRGNATLSWLASDRVTLLGNVTYGHEVYDLPDGVEPPADGAAVMYDTTTLRYAPGVLVQLGSQWRLEGHWEAVRNTDSVANDYDRWFAQLTYEMNERMTLTGLFRKYEFDENRWDDYILDLYAVSVSARF